MAEHRNAKLRDFNEQNVESRQCVKFAESKQWHDLWREAFDTLNDPELTDVHPTALTTVRILSRDAENLKRYHIIEDLHKLLAIAELSEASVQPANSTLNVDLPTEALKCLSNMLFIQPTCRQACLDNDVLETAFRRVTANTPQPASRMYFYLQLLFLLTAFHTSARDRLQQDFNAMEQLSKLLDVTLDEIDCSAEQMNVLSALLKLMFNVANSSNQGADGDDLLHRQLTKVLRKLLIRLRHVEIEQQFSLVTHIINLLTTICPAGLAELTCLADSADAALVEHCFEKHNVHAVVVMLDYLRVVLRIPTKVQHANGIEKEVTKENQAPLKELLPAVLTVLHNCARGSPVMRHYLRREILPPLRDASKRPEVGDELRNHLCRFLTSPSGVLSDLSSRLLFVLCKENVNRMIKYTGFGNAAGLFAARGLLGGQRDENTDYSSDDDDSDTEEYMQVEDQINPVVGCIEQTKNTTLENMSDEQKEYEAVKLANLINQLQSTGMIQPARIGEDGKPVPLQHVLQLQEELPQQQIERKERQN